MGFDAVLKLLAWGILVAVVLQVIFYFVFQAIGYDLFLLSVTLIASVLVGFAVLFAWRIMKNAVAES
jgi:hypothetical protein